MKQTERKAKTVGEIEQMCIHLFARQGIENTTLDEIARHANVTKGAIYWHYASKDALVISVLQMARQTWMEVIPAGIDALSSPPERLHRLFANYLVFIKEHPDLTLFLQRIRFENEPSVRKLIQDFYRESALFIEAILEYGEQEHCFTALSHRELYSFHILSALAGAHAQWFSDSDLDLHALIQEVEQDTFLRLTGSTFPISDH